MSVKAFSTQEARLTAEQMLAAGLHAGLTAQELRSDITVVSGSGANMLVLKNPEGKIPGNRKRQQQRSARTRDQLLRAAEQVFVRDGYEKAALADIAKVAGKTRGAVYSHFKDKEDLFLSLIGACASLHGPRIRELVAEMNRAEGISLSLHHCIGGIVDNSDLVILLMEFQLYSVRHPEIRNRLTDVSILGRGIRKTGDEAYSA